MTSRREEQVEMAIWKELASESLSVSHDHWHIDRVLSFAHQLQSVYGGDVEIITAAAVLHDLGRSDASLHGQDSIDESVTRARKILERADFAADKVEQVITAIDEHDKPEVRPSTTEGRILKDADFLGGFGAWGILRIAMWAGETGEDVGRVQDRLENGMMTRLQNLEFAESAKLARSETLFARLFLAQLNRVATLPTKEHRGRYIVLEGISGTGKDTQAAVLQQKLDALGYDTVRVSEPGEVYAGFRRLWESAHDGETLDDPVIRGHLLLADRRKLVQETVRPALEDGYVVVSARSFISFLVYQCRDQQELATMAFAQEFVPIPDLIVLYDLDAEEAFQRIEERIRERSRYENPEWLQVHRGRYQAVVESGLYGRQYRVVDASGSREEVARRTWRAVEPIIRGIG